MDLIKRFLGYTAVDTQSDENSNTVPSTAKHYEAVNKGFLEWFSSEASADKFEEYFAEYVKALQDIAEGKLIDIKVLLPLLPKGYVAMEQDAKWYWYANEPVICGKTWIMRGPARSLNAFNIKAAEDWTQSLKE